MITVNEKEHVFHLHNGRMSYLLYVMESGQLGHLYFGKELRSDGSYLHMVEKAHRPMTTYITEGDLYTSYEHLRQEYPTYGTSDYRYPALEVQGTDGSVLCKLEYQGYEIIPGKKPLPCPPPMWRTRPRRRLWKFGCGTHGGGWRRCCPTPSSGTATPSPAASGL